MQLCIVASGFESQFAATRDRQQVFLAKINELEQTLSARKTRINKLERGAKYYSCQAQCRKMC